MGRACATYKKQIWTVVYSQGYESPGATDKTMKTNLWICGMATEEFISESYEKSFLKDRSGDAKWYKLKD